MTFELSSQHRDARDRARAFAQSLQVQAAEADRSGRVPQGGWRETTPLLAQDALTMVVVLEEISRVSPAAAVSAIAGASGSPLALSGLRGAYAPDDSPRAQLGLAAVALGLGIAAVETALAEIRHVQGSTTGTDGEKPQWVVADVATDLEAARLLTYKAAESNTDTDIALARLMASAAAERAVDAALRITGPAALGEGHLMERLSRDVRAVSLLLGTEERQRAVAAEGLLPH